MPYSTLCVSTSIFVFHKISALDAVMLSALTFVNSTPETVWAKEALGTITLDNINIKAENPEIKFFIKFKIKKLIHIYYTPVDYFFVQWLWKIKTP